MKQVNLNRQATENWRKEEVECVFVVETAVEYFSALTWEVSSLVCREEMQPGRGGAMRKCCAFGVLNNEL